MVTPTNSQPEAQRYVCILLRMTQDKKKLETKNISELWEITNGAAFIENDMEIKNRKILYFH